VDGLREEFRTHIGGTSQALSTDLWESTERRLLLLSEKIHAVESRSINGLGASATLLPNPVYAAPDPYASGVGSDVRVAQLERTVAELHNILRGVEKNAAPDQSLAVRLDRLEAKLASHTVGATAQMSAMEQVATRNNGDGGAGAEVVAQLQGQIISIQRELEDDSVLNQLSIMRQEIESNRIEAVSMDDRLAQIEGSTERRNMSEQAKLQSVDASVRALAEGDGMVKAQVSDLLGVAHAHATAIQEQDGQHQLLRDNVEQMDKAVSAMTAKLGQLENNSDAGDNSIKAQQHALMSEMTRKLQQNSDGSSGDRVQLQHCCEMVVKLGNKSLEESQKLDQQTELLTLMQQRLEAVAAELQEERRDRIKLEREVNWWREQHNESAIVDDSAGSSELEEHMSPTFQLSDLSVPPDTP